MKRMLSPLRPVSVLIIPFYLNVPKEIKLVLLIGGLIAVVIFLVLWKLPKLQLASTTGLSNKDRIELENNLRLTLAQILGGAFILLGLYFTAESLETSQQTLVTTQQGQITERFTRAIEQLGKSDQPRLDEAGKEVGTKEDNLAIRLGGIFALARIAKESPEDEGPIVEILVTYIRTHAPSTVTKKPVSPDVQAILGILSQPESCTRYLKQHRSIDLSATDLNELRLRNKPCLAGWHLNTAHLENAQLVAGNLEGTDLRGALLSFAYLNGANLKYAKLLGAVLKGTHLEGADLTGAVGIECDQIKTATIDFETKLSPDLRQCWAEAHPTK